GPGSVKPGAFSGVRTGNAVTGVTRFASSNLARSATVSGSADAVDRKLSYSALTIVAATNPQAGSWLRHFLKLSRSGWKCRELLLTTSNSFRTSGNLTRKMVDCVIQND